MTLQRHVLAGHLETERRNLEDAHQSAQGQPIPGLVGPQGLPGDPVTNELWRHSRGSLIGQGVGAAADVPGHELLAADWDDRNPRESHELKGSSADAYLGRKSAPVTSTRVRPSDEDYS